MQSDPRGFPGAAAPLPMGKLPQVTLAFWIMKICATTLGETAGDLLSMTLNVGYGLSSIILISLFAVSLTAQLASNRFHPLLYWTVILTTSTAGTTISAHAAIRAPGRRCSARRQARQPPLRPAAR